MPGCERDIVIEMVQFFFVQVQTKFDYLKFFQHATIAYGRRETFFQKMKVASVKNEHRLLTIKQESEC